MYPGCEVIENGKEISRSENGREVVINNPGRWEIAIVRVDDCLIKNTKRCDYLFRLPKTKKQKGGIQCLKLVELKGKGEGVPYAFEQLAETLKHQNLAQERSLVDECFIVAQLTPSFSSQVQMGKLAFEEEFAIPVNVVSKATIEADCPLH